LVNSEKDSQAMKARKEKAIANFQRLIVKWMHIWNRVHLQSIQPTKEILKLIPLCKTRTINSFRMTQD
jgi:hypothetical protein